MNINKLMQQAQQMQKKMMAATEELKQLDIPVTGGGGAIEIVLKGDGTVKSLKIDKELADDIELLEDSLIATFNEGKQKIEELTKSKLGNLTGGMPLPF